MSPEPELPSMGESADAIAAEVDEIMESTAYLVNRIRAGIRDHIDVAEELEGLAERFRSIARNQQDMVLRLAELGTEALRAEYILDDDQDEEPEEEDDDDA